MLNKNDKYYYFFLLEESFSIYPIFCILIYSNGHYAFVSNSNANKIEVIDMKTFKIVSTIGTGKIPDGLTFIK